jgi:hypothetical protein
MPRSEDGTDDLDNLMALCIDCHNWVEGQVPRLRTFREIADSADRPLEEVKIKPMGDDPYHRPIWHAWVYGGEKNPNV